MFNPFRHAASADRACIGLLALAFAAFLTCAASESPRVLLFVEDSASIYRRAALGFQEGFGHSDKVNTVLVDADGKAIKASLTDSPNRPPQLIVAIGTNTARAAHEKLSGYPILYCLAFDPAHNALTGKNVGGFAFEIELSRQMAEIQRALPFAKRIGVIYDEPVSGSKVRKARQYLSSGVKLVIRDAPNARAAAEAIDGLAGAIDAFWLLWDPVIANPANFRHLVDFCLRNRVALVSPATPFVEAGALMSIGPDYFETGRKTGLTARNILNGKVRLSDLGAEPPAGPLLTINRAVAQRLGINIPPDLDAEILSPR
jgi:putative ABC transport system substrate-binding protein